MSYKTMLTVLTSTEGSDVPDLAVLDRAVALARQEDAHLDVLALGIDNTQVGYFYAGASALVYQQTLERAQAEAAAIEAAVRKRLGPEDIRWGVESAVAQAGGLGGLVGLRARFADLVVQPVPYGKDRGIADEAVVESALFEGQAPVLVLPPGRETPRSDRVILAWDQSSEALAAARRAMPILRRAALVNITVIDPPRHGPERSDPGGLLSQWLARHGVRSEVSVLARTMPRVADVLIRHATDIDADLVVMGAYGHSRFREAILGGTTRSMLEQDRVPVFLAH